MKINRIKLKLISLVFIILIPLFILKIMEITKETKLRIQAEIAACEEYVEIINLTFMNFLERIWSNQYLLGNALIANPEIENGAIGEYLNGIAPKDDVFKTRYYWSTPEGLVTLVKDTGITILDISGRNFFIEIMNGKEKVIGDLEYSVFNGELIVSIARAIRVQGELKGIVINTLEMEEMKHMIPIKRSGARSLLGLTDRNGNVVYRDGNSDILYIEPEVVKKYEGTKQVLKGSNNGYIVKYKIDGVETMGVDYPIRAIGWSSFVNTSITQILEDAKESSMRNIIIFVLVCILSFILAILLSRGFIESIERLLVATHRVKSGDLEARTEISEDNDLMEVGKAFDSMVASLSQKAREEKEYNDFKTQFLATISHEFKTPLNIILGSIQLLESTSIEDEEFFNLLSKYTKIQKQNSYRLLRLVNNFIDMTKIENKYTRPKLQNNDIIKVVEDITMSVVEYTKLKDIKIVFDTDIEEKFIAFDPDMLERMMLNLLSNAIKFTKPGGTIEVNIATEQDIKVSVKDNGIGIPDNKLGIIFNRYSQVENNMRKTSEGTGIGLFLVKSLVELHQGTITVQSKFGEGSEFTITLPDITVIEDYKGDKKDGIPSTEMIHVEFSDIYLEQTTKH